MLLYFSIAYFTVQGQISSSPDPNKRLSQLLIRNWTASEGLPSNNLLSITQTQEGYLWMGSYEGLVQFDGILFRNFDSKSVVAMQRDEVLSLTESDSGALWVGTQGKGLLKYQKGTFSRIDNNLFMNALQARGNIIWIGTQEHGIYQFNIEEEQFTPLNHPAILEITINDMVINEDSQWFASEGNGIISKHGDRYNTYRESASGASLKNCYTVKVDAQGTVWAGSTTGLFFLKDGKFQQVPELMGYIVYDILFDSHGSLWLATSAGIFRHTQKFGFEVLRIDGQDLQLDVRQVILDKEGSIWFTSYRNGLFQVRDGKFTNYTYRDGLASQAIGSLCLLNSGKLLVGSVNGKLNLISEENNTVTDLPIKSLLPKDRVYHAIHDSDNNIWIATYQGLFIIMANGTEKHFTKKDGLHGNQIRHIFQDSNGKVWVGSRSNGIAVFDLKSESVTQHISQIDGLGSNFILSIKEDRQGNILVGTVNGGLNFIRDNRVVRVINSRDGLPGDLIFNSYEDKDGILWICTNNGIARKHKEHITAYTTEDGLLDDAIFDFLEDKDGRIWMPANSGVISIPKEDLNQFAEDSTTNLKWVLFDKGDGMQNDQCAGATHSVIDKQGNIWIPTFDGVAKINPSKVYRNSYSPPVHINAMQVDNSPMDILRKPVLVSPGAHRIVFEFSGLSMIAPEKVQFRYKIQGYDQNWIEDTYERRAIYTNLPHGEYIFKVIATNNDGMWNTEGASLRFTIEPAFTETWVFYFLVLLISGLLIAATVKIRMQRVNKRNLALQAEVMHRTRELSNSNREITQKTAQLSTALKKMTDSVRYAQKIQQAILGNTEQITRNFREGFILLKPRDIVSGDFYWYGHKFGKKIIIAADCTGHGVPGAFMTVMGNDMLNEIVNHNGITEPAAILRELDRMILETLTHEQHSENEGMRRKHINDGMDMAILAINDDDLEFEFAGAKNPLYIVREGKLLSLKGSKYPIGGHAHKHDKLFESQKYKLRRKDMFYLFSDGYQDQFGGAEDRKFMKKRFRETIESISKLPMKEQKEFLENTFYQWKGDKKQTDDILIIGLKV